MTERQLVRRIIRGDKDLFSLLIDQYKLIIFNLMLRYSGSHAVAEELTQDFFFNLYLKLPKYKEKGSFFSWVYTVAIRHAHDWARKNSVEREKMQEVMLDTVGGVPASTNGPHKLELRDFLVKGLTALAEDRRELLILRYCHGCSITELADIFTLSESAIKMRIHRSLQELQETMVEAESLK